MATKPTGADTVPDWPSNANYTVGPSAGQPTTIDPSAFAGNGHIEGVSNPTDARVQNGWQKRAGKWCRWVEAGSSAGAADAHIIECDADGKSSIRKLDILGNSGVGGSSLNVTRGAPGAAAATMTTTGVSTIVFGGDTYAMQVTSSGGGVTIGATGDTIPLTLYPQTTRPTTFTGNDGGIYLEKVAIAGDDAFALRVIANNQRMSVPLYRDQHVHAFEYDGGVDTTFNVGPGADVSILQGPMIFYQGVAPLDANLPMIYDITFQVQVVGFAATGISINFKNNGALIRAFQIEVNNGSAFQAVALRGIYPTGALALAGNSFDVTANKLAGGGANVVIRNAITTIRGAR